MWSLNALHSRPDFRATRAVFTVGTIAAIAVVIACAENGSSITAPTRSREATVTTDNYGSGKHVDLCVDASSPPGNYVFYNTHENDAKALPGYGYEYPAGSGVFWDQGDGGDDKNTVFNVPNGTPTTNTYIVAAGSCNRVIERLVPDADYLAGTHELDGWSAVTMNYVSNSAGAVHINTNCVNDLGVIPAQPYPCGPATTTVRAFTNWNHGTDITFFFAAPTPPCVLGYPNNTGPMIDGVRRSSLLFNEDEVLSAYGRSADEIRVWYTDEHALTLGVRQYFVNNKNTPDVTTNYTIALMGGSNPSSASGSPLAVGSTVYSGPGAAVDPSGRPLHPSLFITDLTTSGLNSKAGDWQYGGTSILPNSVYGTWKGAVVTTDNTKAQPVTTLKPDNDPAKNHRNVGAGGVNPPTGTQDLGYSTEIVWNLSALGLDPNHLYRLQFMVHDGDQNKTGGDVGQACFNVGPGTPVDFTELSRN